MSRKSAIRSKTRAVCPYYGRHTREQITCYCSKTGNKVALSGMSPELIEERYRFACCELYRSCPIYMYHESYVVYEEKLKQRKQ